MTTLTLISADCHAGATPDVARTYVDPAFRQRFDEWLADTRLQAQRSSNHTGQAIYGDEALDDFGAEAAVEHGGVDGSWDSDRRQAELEADGVVAEVIFPGGSIDTTSPFGAGLMTYQYDEDPAIWLEGCRSYNRWLADFCNETPGRRAGVGLITVDDIDVTVAEVEAMRDAGLFGGVVLPASTNGHPEYNHPRYEPLWAACEANDLPVHTHSGWTPNYGDHPGSLGIFLYEISWWAHRPFWFLVWSGAFERHPEMKFVMTEQGATWIPDTLAQLDNQYELPMFRHLRRELPKKPSEYFHRQCYVGASFLGEAESAARHDIGVDKMMWGSDYPHIEGTWPHTREKLQAAFDHVPADEVTRMVGTNAAGVYGFDLEALSPIAAVHGPELSEVTRG